MKATATKKKVSYAKWGYLFILPFFLVFLVFQLVPLVSTFYYSFFEYYRDGLTVVGPNFVGLKNYQELLSADLPKYIGNTIVMWLIGFIPQIIVSLVLAAWFTDVRLRIKGKTFFKVVNLSSESDHGKCIRNAVLRPVLCERSGKWIAEIPGCDTYTDPVSVIGCGNESLVGLMNFLMWFGNTTILLMAAVMGISPSMFEAAELDGADHRQTFFKITLPLIRPILVYVLITSMIGGMQMFDIPQILTNGKGSPNRTATTVIMYLNNHLYSKNYGAAGAISVVLFIICAILCVGVYFTLNQEDEKKHHHKKGGK